VLEVSIRGPCGSGGVRASGLAGGGCSGWRSGGVQASGQRGRRRLGAVSMRRVQWVRTWVKVNLAGLGVGACRIGFPLSMTVSCVPS
jgi:hypothetical protein